MTSSWSLFVFFAIAAKLSDNRMMEKYHTGVYDHRRRAWSCCEM